MDGMLALTIVCVVFAIGDFISDKTHAIIPVLLFASVTFLILFWTGVVPTTLFTDAGLIAISNMMTGIFIVNMGTLLDFKEFVSQWKTVVLGLAIVIVGGILMFFASRPVLGNNFAVALVGPITGGWVSAVVVNDAIKALGSPDSLILQFHRQPGRTAYQPFLQRAGGKHAKRTIHLQNALRLFSQKHGRAFVHQHQVAIHHTYLPFMWQQAKWRRPPKGHVRR